MPSVRPDIDNWVRDRAPKFVSRATFKNLNRWHLVFDADRRGSIAIRLQYCLGLSLFLLLWATEVVCCSGPSRLLRKNRARRLRSKKKPCESVSGAALSLRSRPCWRVFSALFQAQLIIYWVVHIFLGSLEPGLPRTVGFMAGLTATFRAPRREFWLFDDRAGLCHCGKEVGRRLCLSVQGVLGIFFRHLLKLTWCLSLACISVVALAWMCRVTPPRYILSDFLACGKFSPVRRKCGAVRWGTLEANHLWIRILVEDYAVLQRCSP